MPERLAILGGGVVGVEMAQAWSSLGSQVTLVEAADRVLASEEPFAGEQVRSALHERGVDVQVGVKATAVRARDGEVELELETGGPVRGDELLVAVGRRPRTDDLGLETVGLEPGKPIEVDDRMRANDWLYAIGDVNGRVLLTHMGKYQARIAADVILGEDMRVINDDARVAAGDLHGPAGGRGGLHARGRARRGPRTCGRWTCPRSRRPAPASTAATTRPAPRGWWWTRTAGWWWAPRSRASRWPSGSTRPRSP